MSSSSRTSSDGPPHLWQWLVAAFQDVERTRLGGLLLGNVWPAYVFAVPLVVRVWSFLQWRSDGSLHAAAAWIQELLTIVFLALVVVLFAIRRRQLAGRHATFIPGLVALLGTFLLNAVAYLPVAETTSTEALLASSVIVIVGTLWTIWSLSTLGRYFGIFPEVRGLVQSGPYGVVRHPVYLGEAISAVGMVVARPEPLILLMFMAFIALQYARAIYEEQALSAAFPEEYPEYARRVARFNPVRRPLPWPRHAFVLAIVALVVLVGELPHVLAACCAPAGDTGFGTAWFVNDFAQYESAMRQGTEHAGWLVHDPFTAEPHPEAFMFPLYVGIGKLAATLQIPTPWLEELVAIVARVLLVVALWRFCRAFASGRLAARWALGLALFASGFELFAALFGGYTGNWSYEMNGLGLLFAAPHVPLAMAATLELAREGLRPRRVFSVGWLARIAVLSAMIGLLHPFHEPVLLGALSVAGLAFWRSGRGAANLAAAAVAGAAALPVLVPTVATFSFEAFWVATYSTQNLLPSPAPHELLVDLGPTLLLGLAGAVLLQGRVAPFGLVLWLLFAAIAMYLPVPYQRRLAFGVEPALAVVAANAVVAIGARLSPRRAAAFRLATFALAASSTALMLVMVVASGLTNGPLPVYRSTSDLDAAAAWLDGQASADDTVLADWDASNYLAARTPARVVGGHPVATLRPDQKRFQIATVFAHPSSLIVARALGAQWLVFGPEEASLVGPSTRPDFQSGVVRVYRVA